jgi:hypothetical protein
VTNNDCLVSEGAKHSLPFTLTVSVAPDYANHMDGPPPATPHWQPDSVYEILGSKFENMTGAQVRFIAGMNILQVSGQYQLPADTCKPQ